MFLSIWLNIKSTSAINFPEEVILPFVPAASAVMLSISASSFNVSPGFT